MSAFKANLLKPSNWLGIPQRDAAVTNLTSMHHLLSQSMHTGALTVREIHGFSPLDIHPDTTIHGNLTVLGTISSQSGADPTNTYLGTNSGSQNTVGRNNTAVGNNAQSGTVGELNVALGASAGSQNAFASGTIAIGVNSQATQDFATAIGYNSQATQANAIAIGREIANNNFRSVAIGQSTNADNQLALGINPTAGAPAVAATLKLPIRLADGTVYYLALSTA